MGPNISLRVRKTTVLKEFALLHQTELVQRKLTNGVVLECVSLNAQAHSLMAVFFSRANLYFIWSGSAARQSRLISDLTFGNELRMGVMKAGIEFSGSTASPVVLSKQTRKVYFRGSTARRFTSHVDWRAAEPLERYFLKLSDEPPSYSIDIFFLKVALYSVV